jgi:hypothetical protein
MFLGDSFITPAISVLSAVEGLKLATPALEHYVIPITLAILVALFSVQSHGTARVASFFGPITATWFLAIAVLGAMHIFDDPHVLHAINPYYALHFLFTNGTVALVTLGLVFLAVTGGEALYADLGHFGRKPIRLGWFALVMPALLINYFGQGALVLANPAAIENSFYRLVPDVLLIPMVVLATAATVIASQAVITGAYSLVQQAIQLGFLPRFAIVHTSEDKYGQIYMRQYDPPDRRRTAGADVPLVERARVRVRHCGRDHDGGGRSARLHRDLGVVEVEMVAGGLAHYSLRADRQHLPCRQHAETVRRRLGAAAIRGRDGADNVDLAAGHAHPCQQDAPHRSAARYAGAQS